MDEEASKSMMIHVQWLFIKFSFSFFHKPRQKKRMDFNSRSNDENVN